MITNLRLISSKGYNNEEKQHNIILAFYFSLVSYTVKPHLTGTPELRTSTTQRTAATVTCH